MKKRKLTKEGSKQVPWDDLNKEYASHKEIRDDIRKHPDKYSNIKNKAYSDLRKLCENSAVRYMRSGQKCKIHYWDFIACVGKKKEIDPSELPKELIKRGWKKIWSLKPFDEGEFCKYYAPGKLPKFGAIRKPSDKKIRFVEETIQAPLKVSNARAFLQTKCNVSNLSGWGWDEMMVALVFFRDTQDEGAEASSNGQGDEQTREQSNRDKPTGRGKLTDFIYRYVDLSEVPNKEKPNKIQSIKTIISKNLPNPVLPAQKPGQGHLYDFCQLHKKWPSFSEKSNAIPPLKVTKVPRKSQK